MPFRQLGYAGRRDVPSRDPVINFPARPPARRHHLVDCWYHSHQVRSKHLGTMEPTRCLSLTQGPCLNWLGKKGLTLTVLIRSQRVGYSQHLQRPNYL
ncbi:hypothetical protein Hamer_G004599 [Homarus americanus]|uniref:Uncharacterized protein n=1 Tax=Homarus americanus TaxID=6706 RepID=A0A8J5JW55_HOMAM|nr:hypothetical protein Hamer_G004599 [Homarus americanus]